jgi:ribosomal protein L21E
MKSSKGARSGTRRKLKGRVRTKFKPAKFLKEFKPGDKVIISPDPSVQKGLPFHRFKGKMGTVDSKRGNAFIVRVKTGKAEKTVITGGEHLRLLKVV